MRKAKRKKRKKERPNGRIEKEERKVGKKERERERVKSCNQWVPWCSVIYGNAIKNRVMETENS